jgi:polar amino acid transport system ATP-binding protein
VKTLEPVARAAQTVDPSAGGQTRLLRIQGLDKRFGPVHVLRDLDLDLAENARLVVIGPSGGGKSTLLRCAMGLEPIDGGAIYFGDAPYVEARSRGRRSHTFVDKRIQLQVGMVFQHYTLFPHLSVMQNLVLAPVLVRKRRKGEAIEAGRALLDRFNLLEKADEYPSRLSGGQKQRVAIARALMMEPRLMLFDEITSALDPELVKEVLSVMLQLAEQSMTMMIITHEMDFARKIATWVAFIDQGRIMEQGPPERILTAPTEPRTREFLDHFIVG